MSRTFFPVGQLIPRVFLTSVVLVAVVLVSTVWAVRDPGLTAVVKVGYLPVRSTPDRVGATIAQLSGGQAVDLTGYRTPDSQWVQVRLLGVEGGWVPTDGVRTRFLVANLTAITLTDGHGTAGVAVVAAEKVTVREGWGTIQPVVAQFSQGQQLELSGFRTEDDEWIQVVLPGGQRGWVEAVSISSGYPFSALVPIKGAQ